MIENYALLAMVTLQILVGSVLNPALFIRRRQPAVAGFPVERFAELFPGVPRDRSAERFAARFCALNTGIAMLGLILLGWLFIHMQRQDWTEEKTGGKVVGLLGLYFALQILPGAFIAWKAGRSLKALKTSLAHGKRKAVLQRRGLFDFVSPFLVFLAVSSYVLFVALVLYIRQRSFPGFDALPYVVIITLVYALNAFLVYGWLYGKNRVPLATYADRLFTIGAVVKTFMYTCIGVTVFMAADVALGLLHWQSWLLSAVSAFFVICSCLTAIGPRSRPTPLTRHTQISLPVAELDKCVGRYDLGNGFSIAIGSDGTTLWWLRLGIPGAQPVPLFPEAPLAFFWRDIDQQIRFITDASGAVIGAEITQGRHFVTGRRAEPEGSPTVSPPIDFECGPA